MSDHQFKVIVAGGGPAGLVAAHALHLAGIEFTVLEQRDEIALDVGASLVLSPQSLRVLHQFGLRGRLREIGAELVHNTAYTVDGVQFGDSYSFKYMKANHGIAPVAFHRAQLIESIYDGLPDAAKSRVLTGKRIQSVKSNEEGVEVTCVDGTIHRGSVLIGADGVHSKTRRQMRELALKTDAGLDWDPDVPYAAEYKCMWATFPKVGEPGEFNETHSKGHALMYIAGRTRGWIFLYEKLPHKTTARVNYTDQDVLTYANSFAEFPVTKGVKVKDVFAKRMHAGMSVLEEGVVEHWSWGRIALVGDAAHKYTPNGGLGLNNGIQDVVALCNGLTALVKATPNKSPTLDDLTEVFEVYQNQRRQLAIDDCNKSGFTTRMHADANLIYYIIGHYLMWIGWIRYVLVKLLSPRTIRKGLVLDYVSADEPLMGTVSWDHPMKATSSEAAVDEQQKVSDSTPQVQA